MHPVGLRWTSRRLLQQLVTSLPAMACFNFQLEVLRISAHMWARSECQSYSKASPVASGALRADIWSRQAPGAEVAALSSGPEWVCTSSGGGCDLEGILLMCVRADSLGIFLL